MPDSGFLFSRGVKDRERRPRNVPQIESEHASRGFSNRGYTIEECIVQAAMTEDPIMLALAQQVSCYRKLVKLAAVQHDHIQHGRTEELLGVLQSRQEVLDELTAHEKLIGPAKQNWAEYGAKLDPQSRKQAETLLAETRALLEKITSADRNDVLVLQQRKLNIGRQIQQTAAARQVNRNYAAAAYTAPRGRVDVQM